MKNTEALIDQKCVACDGAILAPFGTREDYLYAMCPSCNTLQQSPFPSAEFLRNAYEHEYLQHNVIVDETIPEPGELNAMNSRYHRFVANCVIQTGSQGPVLEIGCGFGGVGEMLLAAGVEWEGIEYSQRAVDYCRSRRLPVRMADIKDMPSGHYSTIIMVFVFEHLCDYPDFLGQCRRILIPGGHLVTLHPTGPFARLFGHVFRRNGILPRAGSAFMPPWHTALFSMSGMDAVARNNGFSIARVLPSVSPRVGNLPRRVTQAAFEAVNKSGFSLFGKRWPLAPAHLFIMNKAR